MDLVGGGNEILFPVPLICQWLKPGAWHCKCQRWWSDEMPRAPTMRHVAQRYH